MRFLLNLVYLLLLLAAAPWLVWNAVRHGKYREGWAARWWGAVPRRDAERPCVWFHAVSVGEVTLLAPLLARIRRECPDWDTVLSTTTRTGFALARQRYPQYPVFYAPLDFSWAAERAVRRIRPDVLVLVELEVWPNLIAAARRAGARVAVVNGRLSPHSYAGYRRIRRLLAPTFQRIQFAGTQNATYAARFRDLGVPSHAVEITGSLKFDGARTDRKDPAIQELARLAGIRETDTVFLAGSTQAPEEALAIEAYVALRDVHPELRLILVPRHPERFERVARQLDESGVPWVRRSDLSAPAGHAGPRVLLVDTVGELGAWWGTSQIAFVGGSMGTRGGQNMIEPAAFGAAVSFGPQTRNFRDVVELLGAGDAAVVVRDQEELTSFVRRCLEDPAWAAGLGTRARQIVVAQQGATQRTLQGLVQLIARTRQQAA